jgi:GT2 family glycosyltransferase
MLFPSAAARDNDVRNGAATEAMSATSARNPTADANPPSQLWMRGLGASSLGDSDALARSAGARLAQGDYEAAFALADRRCRVIVPSAHDLFLRALTHKAAGRLESARRDLQAALALDPTDAALDAAALVWGADESRIEAAERIVDRATTPWPLRRTAVAALVAAGARVTHRLRRGPEGVSGWIAWTGGEPLRIEMSGEGEPQSFRLEPDPDHPLASGEISAAEIAVEAPDLSCGTLTLIVADGAIFRVAPKAEARPRPRPPATRLRRETAAGAFVTIIVPVYEDYEATRACLESLSAARPACAHQILVVDDASPNLALKAWLDEAAGAGAFKLIRNETNLGFAAAVNKALAERARGDALLLNADALPPPGAVDRLMALSRAAPDIGTLTPFSNNGELTSYPAPHAANPMPSASEIAVLDAAARALNGDALVDIPNGIGFCLYITEACLDAVGPLPEHYAEGYYEDVEFCLMARERGFRNVAAPGAFVGHAGSKSFAARKRALVMRNREIVEARFPGLKLETAAFVALDPLKPYRAALDAALPPRGPAILVACGPRAAALGRRGAAKLAGENPDATVLTLIADARGTIALCAVGGGAPQSLSFRDDAAGAASLADYLGRLDVAKIEFRDPAGLPDAALSALIGLNAGIDLACDDLGVFAATPAPPAGPCAAPGQPQPCEGCRRFAVARPQDEERRRRLALALERAQRILPQDRLAESFARRVFKARAQRFGGPARAAPPLRREPILRLGALYPQRSPAIERLLLRLGRRLAGLERELVVIGAALDDSALMATGAVFVTGRAAPEDYADIARCYGVEALLGPDRAGGYGDLEATAAALGAAAAYFDWTFGAFPVERGDLSLDPRICDDKATESIVAWMNGELAG